MDVTTPSRPRFGSAGHTLTFHGGLPGALAPFVVFLGGVAWLGLSGAPDERGFWPILLIALTAGVLVARDRAAYADVVIGGMSRPLVGLMILAWMLAGVLASLLGASGLLEALVEVARSLGVSGGGYVGVAFLIACATSTATGTSLGTLLLTVPLLYPPGAGLGADPVLLIAALLGGATFGDNISPVSDTTIASTNTQGATMARVVKSRLRYALPAAAIALALFVALGGAPASEAGGQPSVATASAASLLPLVMIAAPALVFALLLAGQHLVVGMLAGSVCAVALGLGFGLLQPGELLFIDHDAYIAKGLIADGMERAVGVSIFTLLLMGLTAGIEATGILDRVLEAARRHASSARRAELWIVGATSAAVLLTTHSVVAILTVGRFARDMGESYGLRPERRANLLDVTVCTYPFLLPYFIPTLLAASLSQSGFAAGAPRVSAWQAGLWNFHSWALLAILLFAVISGWGRGEASRTQTPPSTEAG